MKRKFALDSIAVSEFRKYESESFLTFPEFRKRGRVRSRAALQSDSRLPPDAFRLLAPDGNRTRVAGVKGRCRMSDVKIDPRSFPEST